MERQRVKKLSSFNELSILDLGKRIREIRKKRNKSLQILAEDIGVSRSLLSQIERRKTTPSLNTLWNLADRLGVSMSELFKKEDENKLIIEHAQIENMPTGVQYYILSPRVFAGFEFAYVEYSPGGSSGVKPAQHNGMEYFLVLEGEIEATVGKELYFLRKSNGIYFSAKIAHNMRNPGKKKARVLFVVTPGESGMVR